MDHHDEPRRTRRTATVSRKRLPTGIALLLLSAGGALVISSRTPQLNGSAESIAGAGHSQAVAVSERLRGDFGHSLTVSDSVANSPTTQDTDWPAPDSTVHPIPSNHQWAPSFAESLQWSGGGHSLVADETSWGKTDRAWSQDHLGPDSRSSVERSSVGAGQWTDAPRLPERPATGAGFTYQDDDSPAPQGQPKTSTPFDSDLSQADGAWLPGTHASSNQAQPSVSPLAGLTGPFGHSSGPHLSGPQFRAVSQTEAPGPGDADRADDSDEVDREATSAEEELQKYERQLPLRDAMQSGKQWLARVNPTENVPESIPFADWKSAGDRHQLVMRQWCPQNKTWEGPRLRHPAVYFEDDDLERFGNHYGILQPAVSAGKFYGTLGLLPVKALCQPPCQCYRDVDFPRPGSPQSIAPGCLQTSGQLLSLGPVDNVEFPALRQAAPCPNCSPQTSNHGGQ